MKLIKRYIGSSILQTTSLVLLILIGLEFFITFIAQLDDIGRGHYTLWQALLYVPLTLPVSVYTLFPMAGLLGSLLGLGNLATHSELIVMRSSGVTTVQVIKSVLRIAIIMWFGMFIIGEVIGPISMNYAETNKRIAMTGGQAIRTHHGFWLREKNTFIHIEKILPERHLEDVDFYQFNNQNQLTNISIAKNAFYKNHAWWLQNIAQTIFLPNHHTQVVKKKIQNWPIELNTNLFHMSKMNPDELSLIKLYQLIQYRKANGLRISSDLLTFWQRVFLPLATCIMIFFAIPFIFGPLRTVTIGLRILTGVLAGFSFYLVNQFFGPLSLVYQFPPILGAALPSLLFLLIGLGLMKL